MASSKQSFPAPSAPFVAPINVINNGYKWSQAAADAAAAKGAFIRVGKGKVTRRYLSGFARTWESSDTNEHRTIFSLDARITGLPEDVRAALKYANVVDENIDAIIANAITKDNYQTTKKQDFDDELAARNSLKETKPSVAGYEWPQIVWFATNIKSATVITKNGESKEKVTATSVSNNASASKTLAEKVKSIGRGKVMDVSDMQWATGKGARARDIPKTSKTGKFGFNLDKVPVISNNYDQYVTALKHIYGPGAETEFAYEIEEMRKALSAPKEETAAPKVEVKTSAPVVPAPVVVPPVASVPSVRTPTYSSPVRSVGGSNFPSLPQLSQLGRK